MKFADWMEKNREKFTTYNDQEVKDLALTCGFAREEVYQWFDHADRRAA